MAFDELDRTTRYIRDAKARALEVLNEASPKLTALEKAMWMKLKRGNAPAKTAMANIPEESIDAEAASCLQYVALDAFKDKELTDHQEKQKRDDPRIQHDFSAAADGASAWRQTLCCLCVEWAVLGIC